MPSSDTLEEYGLDEGEIEEIQATFVGERRALTTSEEHSEVERLITEFDCSRVEVGLVRFLDAPRDHSQGVQFAYCEADFIFLKENGSVVLVDGRMTESNGIKCATDFQRFLDGLGAFVEIRANKSNWKKRSGEAASLCAEAAGGSENLEFYRMLCSFLD